MVHIDKKEYRRLLITWIVFCIGVIIAQLYQKSVFLVFSSLCLGYFVFGFYTSYNKSWKAKFDIGISLAFFGLLLLFNPPLLARLDHCYFNNTTVDFEKYIKDENVRNHKFVFAIDNSGGYLETPLSLDNVNSKSDTLKLRLIADLTKVLNENDNNDDFIIIKIGEQKNYIFDANNDWLELNQENVKQSIQDIISIKPENKISDFYSFYKTMKNICENNNYSLFIYSDFIFDLTKETTKPNESDEKVLNKDFSYIQDYQKELDKNQVTQNCFYVPITNIQKDERNILPENNTTYTTLFDITSMSRQELIPQKIIEIENLPFFYFDNINMIRSSLLLKFRSKENHHIIDTENKFIIYDGIEANKYSFNKDNPNSLNNKEICLTYENSLPPAVMPKIKIIQKDKEYVSTCNITENKDVWWRLWYFLIFVIIGFFIGVLINRLMSIR